MAREVCKDTDNSAFPVLLQNQKEFQCQNNLLACITILHASLLLTLATLCLVAPLYKLGTYITPQNVVKKAGN